MSLLAKVNNNKEKNKRKAIKKLTKEVKSEIRSAVRRGELVTYYITLDRCGIFGLSVIDKKEIYEIVCDELTKFYKGDVEVELGGISPINGDYGVNAKIIKQ